MLAGRNAFWSVLTLFYLVPVIMLQPDYSHSLIKSLQEGKIKDSTFKPDKILNFCSNFSTKLSQQQQWLSGRRKESDRDNSISGILQVLLRFISRVELIFGVGWRRRWSHVPNGICRFSGLFLEPIDVTDFKIYSNPTGCGLVSNSDCIKWSFTQI